MSQNRTQRFRFSDGRAVGSVEVSVTRGRTLAETDSAAGAAGSGNAEQKGRSGDDITSLDAGPRTASPKTSAGSGSLSHLKECAPGVAMRISTPATAPADPDDLPDYAYDPNDFYDLGGMCL